MALLAALEECRNRQTLAIEPQQGVVMAVENRQRVRCHRTQVLRMPLAPSMAKFLGLGQRYGNELMLGFCSLSRTRRATAPASPLPAPAPPASAPGGPGRNGATDRVPTAS